MKQQRNKIKNKQTITINRDFFDVMTLPPHWNSLQKKINPKTIASKILQSMIFPCVLIVVRLLIEKYMLFWCEFERSLCDLVFQFNHYHQ